MYENPIFTKEKDILVVGFVLFDQLIKIIISKFFTGIRVYALDGMVGFAPTQNTYLSNIFYLLRIKPHVIVPMIVSAFAFVVVYMLLYEVQKVINEEEICLDLAVVFGFSGIICYLIDVVFWGGSLDYIYLRGYMILDMKDVYIRWAEVLVVVALIKHRKKILKKK